MEAHIITTFLLTQRIRRVLKPLVCMTNETLKAFNGVELNPLAKKLFDTKEYSPATCQRASSFAEDSSMQKPRSPSCRKDHVASTPSFNALVLVAYK